MSTLEFRILRDQNITSVEHDEKYLILRLSTNTQHTQVLTTFFLFLSSAVPFSANSIQFYV